MPVISSGLKTRDANEAYRMVFVNRLTLRASHFAVSVNISHLVIIQNA